MPHMLMALALLLGALVVVLQILCLQRSSAVRKLGEAQERLDRALRDELARSAQGLRGELAASIKGVGDSLHQQMVALVQTSDHRLSQARVDAQMAARTLQEGLANMEGRLRELQEDNGRRLEQMRATVDEKLQGTLEQRLGASFRLVSERLEQVHRGLGEMQALASGVGDLKKVLTHVNVRGIWGEAQLSALLEQVLAPDQYAANVAPRGGSERVEFAVRMPGQGEGQTVWLPIDAKFPLEDYQRLLEASDPEGAELAGRQLESRLRHCARDICSKYLQPPLTTDFAILFLPAEGLFAEVLRRPGLAEQLQREHRVVITGPATLWSVLNSLQMGFRTLAIQQRSGEVWHLLAAVKTEWRTFGEVLDKIQKQLHQASETLEKAQVRTRAIGRKLKDVQELPTAEASQILEAEPTSGR